MYRKTAVSKRVDDISGKGTVPCLSVVIPVFNEVDSIGHLLRKLKRLYPDAELLVVDDGSTDQTSIEAEKAGACVIRHPYNIGNGAAVKTGIRRANGDIIVFMDGDGQHQPEEVEKLIACLPEYDMAVGARFMAGQSSVTRGLGNKVFNYLASYVAKFQIRDLTSGFRAVKAEVARNYLSLLPNTYSYPTTITLGVLRDGRSLAYVPITVNKRKKGKSNIHLFHDGVRFFMIILKICTLYSPMRVFLPVSAAFFGVGTLYYGYTYLSDGRFTNMGALLLTTSAIIFMMGLVSEQVCQMRFEKSNGQRTE
jgi:glycosyltransferase involved in cell wall biosynthesis